MKTPDVISIIALMVSIAAGIFSGYAFYETDKASKQQYTTNFRPYVVAANFGYKGKDDKIYDKMNEILLKVFNVPALILSEKVGYYERLKGIDSPIFVNPEYKAELIVPGDFQQLSTTSDSTFVNDKMAIGLKGEFIRKVRIEYQWISDSALHYYFESEWQYDKKQKYWAINYQNAN